MRDRSSVIAERLAPEVPFFSICVPQYNRTSFLLVLLRAIRRQSFRRVEVCISDGGSNDGGHSEILQYLHDGPDAFRYYYSEENLRYDANLRSSLALARGRYCFLFGNDDTLADMDVLKAAAETLEQFEFPEVAIANYLELSTRRTMRRVSRTGILGAGPRAALAHFRQFSFVSGLILEREPVQRFETAEWDGSEMYQTYLGCRLLAAGGRLLGIEQVMVHKDVQIPGEVVESYTTKPRVKGWRVAPQYLPLGRYGALALSAVSASQAFCDQSAYARRIFEQVLLFTYPPWLVEYRRVQSWAFAAGVALGMRPDRILRGCKVNWCVRAYLWLLYVVVTVAGLLVPKTVFTTLRPMLHRLAKR